MEMRIGVLADAANESKDGKLNVMGTFNNIAAATFPAIHRRMTLVAQFRYAYDETREGNLSVVLIDPDGKEANSVVGRVALRLPEGGLPGTLNLIIASDNLLLTRPGSYRYQIAFDQELIATIPFSASLVSPSA